MSHRFGSTELWRKCEWETFPVPKQNNTNTITIHNIKDLDGAASTAPPKTVPPVPKKNTAEVTVPTNSTTNGTPAPSAPIKSALKQSLSRPKEPTAPGPSESIYIISQNLIKFDHLLYVGVQKTRCSFVWNNSENTISDQNRNRRRFFIGRRRRRDVGQSGDQERIWGKYYIVFYQRKPKILLNK